MVRKINTRGGVNGWAVAFILALAVGALSTAYNYHRAQMFQDSSVIVIGYTLDLIDYANEVRDQLNVCITVNKANEEIYGIRQ
jgi:hypothetical protein